MLVRSSTTASTKKYALVVKDDSSGFFKLHPTVTADAPACASASLGWFKRFGVVKQWGSDQGTHFRNEVMKILARTLDSLGGRAPLTAFTGLPPTTPLTVVFSDDHEVEMSAAVLQRSEEQHLTQMAEVLEAMHRDVAETSDRRRMQARARRASKSKPPIFSVGDFVLAAMVTQHASKLVINWQEPKRIVRAISDWVFEGRA
ncbi:unnamed protein product [Phytophthora fragariaefolia]|uniref:Unnamed protein product n=1 Tax=Phytophthora fragariaefolia TaxID=1490495 RepID=A0A9W6XGC2_9STRA|nr:unnamed protein product [Phytophthora fragariaefolia]